MNKYYNTFNENLYLHINNFFNKKNQFLFRKIINNIEKHKLSRISRCLNNRNVAISSRYQILLYIQRYKVLNSSNKSIIDSYFNNIYNLLSPIIIKPIINMFNQMNIKNVKLCRMSIMYTCPGNPTQEIHVDDDIDKKMFYIAIPLHDTPIKMGPIVLFSHKYTKQYLNSSKKTFGLLKNNPHLTKYKVQNNNYLGDIVLWTNNTFHYGSTNNTKNIRKYIFLILSSDNNTIWNYEIDINENNKIIILNDKTLVRY
jgi:hypothetical protein